MLAPYREFMTERLPVLHVLRREFLDHEGVHLRCHSREQLDRAREHQGGGATFRPVARRSW